MNRHETGARAQVSRRTLLTGAGKGVGALGAGLLLARAGCCARRRRVPHTP